MRCINNFYIINFFPISFSSSRRIRVRILISTLILNKTSRFILIPFHSLLRLHARIRLRRDTLDRRERRRDGTKIFVPKRALYVASRQFSPDVKYLLQFSLSEPLINGPPPPRVRRSPSRAFIYKYVRGAAESVQYSPRGSAVPVPRKLLRRLPKTPPPRLFSSRCASALPSPASPLPGCLWCFWLFSIRSQKA